MKTRLAACIVLTAAFASPPAATAASCPMCRDTTAGSSPQTRKALRVAIPLLGLPAITIFAGALVLARRTHSNGQR